MCKHGTSSKTWVQKFIIGHWSVSCRCDSGWTDHHCATDIDECKNEKLCQNRGTCENTVGSYNCKCLQGFYGMHCEHDLNTCRSNPCKNRGVCRNYENYYNCKCRAGFKGRLCETDLNTCRSNPCRNRGVCRNYDNYYNCKCRAGYIGRLCETDINTCRSNPCRNRGICSNYINKYFCKCRAGFKGRLCETAINECESYPCMNGGTCKDGHLSYRCNCVPGFRGKHCMIGGIQDPNDCMPPKCNNGGTCIDGYQEYECKCLPAFTGTHCDTEMVLCTIDNCVHGDCGEMYRCSCNHGYTGAICDTAICNYAICDVCNVDGIRCDQCDRMRTGKNCETELCHPMTCLHGECSEDFYDCKCQDGYTGTKCDQEPELELTVRIEGYNGHVNVGEQLALQCIPSDEETKFSFTWTYTSVDGNVSYIPFTQNLTIKDVMPENAGNYSCYIVDVNTESISREVSVTVEVRDIPESAGLKVENMSSKPLIGITSVFLIMFLLTASYLVWKRKDSQRKIEDNGVEDVVIDDFPTGDTDPRMTPSEIDTY